MLPPTPHAGTVLLMEDPEIHGMLQVAQGDDVVQEFAWICLQRYRRETQIILGWRQQDYALGVHLLGMDPDALRQTLNQQRDELLDRARERLRERLRGLLAWAERTARL